MNPSVSLCSLCLVLMNVFLSGQVWDELLDYQKALTINNDQKVYLSYPHIEYLCQLQLWCSEMINYAPVGPFLHLLPFLTPLFYSSNPLILRSEIGNLLSRLAQSLGLVR